MKLMVCLVLVALCYAAEPTKQSDEQAAKRQLQEGNFGVRIQPSIQTEMNPQSGSDGNQNELRQGPPHREYGPPKISDVLTGQGSSFPAAIQSHLYSPVQVYQPRLGSPTKFEVSPPVPSPLAYSEHKIYQPSPINAGNQALNQNIQQNQDQPLQISQFPGIGQLQPPLPPRPDLPNELYPHLNGQGQINPIQRQQVYKQVFAERSGQIPQDIYQQINQLSQMNFDGSLQNSDAFEQQGIQESENSVQQQEQNQKLKNQVQNSEQQGQIIEEQNRGSEQQSSTPRPQTVSYASFSQSLPENFQSQYQSQIDHSKSSPEPPQPQQGLPQPQSPPLFQTTKAVRTQSVFQPTTTTVPQSTVYTTVNQKARRIGVVKIRNEPIVDDVTTPQSFTVSSIEPQGSSSTSSFLSSEEKSQSIPTQEQTSSTRVTTPKARQRMTFRQFTRPTVTPRSTQHSMFTSRPTFSPLLRRRTTLESFSTLPTSTLTPTSIVTETSPTAPLQPALETLSSLPPQPIVTTLSTLPSQPSILTSSSFTSQPLIFTSPTTTPQPQTAQSTLTPIPLFTPNQNTQSTLQTQFSTSLQPLQQSSTIQPIPKSQSQLLPSSVQPNIPNVTPFPIQKLAYDVQSEPQSVIKIQEKFSQQYLQPFIQLPQFQYIQGPQQIQQQLQLIQQQLELLQQPFIQQQPQPVQIIQQQNSPFPQPIQLLQQQPIPQQPVQLVQQQPQLIQQQPQLVTPRPQLIQPQPQPQLTQSQPQLVPTQPQSIQPQLIQPQPQLIQEQPQLIQQQPQLIQEQSQVIQQQPQLIQEQSQVIQQQPQLIQEQPQIIQQQPQLIQEQPQIIQQQPQLIQEQPQLIQQQPQLIQEQPQLIQQQPQLIQEQPQVIQQHPQLIQTLPQPVQLGRPQPPLVQTPTQSVQIVEQKPEPQTTPQPVTLLEKPQPSPLPAIETQSNQQEQQNQNAQKEEQDKQEINEVQKIIENEAYYNQLLHNNLYSEELYASLQQPLFPVPVGISSYPSAPAFHSSYPTAFTASPFTASPFSATPLPLHSAHLHSPHLHSPHLHASPLHSAPYHDPYHSTHAFPSVQFFGKYANGIFGAGWKRKK